MEELSQEFYDHSGSIFDGCVLAIYGFAVATHQPYDFEVVNKKDYVRVAEQCYPVGSLFGLNVYEAVHVKTNQKVYVTVEELLV